MFLIFQSFAQEKPIKIEEERKANRLFLYALNENLTTYDMTITVKGTGFRQPKSKPRLIRIPATSRVNVINLIVERDQEPKYTYDITVNDSLSRRALKKEFTLIKIDPKKSIFIYVTEKCISCDSIIYSLQKSPYRFNRFDLIKDSIVRKQLEPAFVDADIPLNELTSPVIQLNGRIYTKINSYAELMARMEEE